MFVCNNPKIAYPLIPKTGTRTMLQVLGELFPNGKQISGHKLEIIPNDIDDHFVFTTVRNPYDRLCSAWWSTCKRGEDRYGYLKAFKRHKLPNEMLSFLRMIDEGKDPRHQGRPGGARTNAMHAWSMKYWTTKFHIDKILRFENLLEDFRSLPFIPGDIELPHINPTTFVVDYNPHVRPPWQELIGEEEAKLVNLMFKDDFEEFGYEMLWQ